MSCSLFPNSSSSLAAIFSPISSRSVRLKSRACFRPLAAGDSSLSSVALDSLRLLEWDKVCHSVAGFAATSLGREALRTQLWSVSSSYEESVKLLGETNAAVEMLKYGASGMDFGGVDLVLVNSALRCVQRGIPMDGFEAMAIASLLQFADTLQSSVNMALKEDSEWYNRFMPLTEVILNLNIEQTLIKSIQQVIDVDGSVKDTASSELKRCRDQVRTMERKVTKLEGSYPVPVDFLVAKRTRVLVITGPNTGGKTISLKTVGLAALMAKSGLYVLASEPARIPWFDSIFADIGDEQSLTQSLSTFSGHLKQISAIQKESTRKSLVLLDEVGAGTNPLEGAALGMSLLEAFSQSGSLLTVATTHHGELKALKYSNSAFENACMEFDEVNMKPTYKILWGIPGPLHNCVCCLHDLRMR